MIIAPIEMVVKIEKIHGIMVWKNLEMRKKGQKSVNFFKWSVRILNGIKQHPIENKSIKIKDWIVLTW